MKHSCPPVTAVPGRLRIGAGTRADYQTLARHHYREQPPATFCRIRVARYVDPIDGAVRVVGVAVLSWPVPMLKARLRHLAVLGGATRVRRRGDYGRCLRFANANVRTVSRVIVHPQFRALGLASRLVRSLIAASPTRYVESSAVMGRFAGFLTAAGMTRVPTPAGEPAYFVVDRVGRVGAKRRPAG